MALIDVEALKRTYWVRPHEGFWSALLSSARPVDAVCGISFSVQQGECVGLLGPNGAGKSTALKMLTGVLVPTSGRAIVAGLVPHRDRVALARKLGAVFGQRTQLWWDLSPGAGFSLLRRIYRVEQSRHDRLLGELVERLELGPLLDVPVRSLSLGQKMRCELAAALLHEPELLVLDEPTIGLDVVVKEEIHRFLRERQARGTTILLTSHDLDDIEALCSRVIVIDRGQILHDGSLPSLKARYGQRRTLSLRLAREIATPELPEHTRLVSHEGHKLVVELEGEAGALIQHLLARCEVTDLSVSEVGIEDVVKRLYREG